MEAIQAISELFRLSYSGFTKSIVFSSLKEERKIHYVKMFFISFIEADTPMV